MPKDLFNTRSFIESSIHPVVDKLLKKGGAIAIHANFGMGKSRFCAYYAQFLEEMGVTHTVIDASLYDYGDEPFIPINQELCKLIPYERFAESAKKVLNVIAKSTLSYVSGVAPMLGIVAHAVVGYNDIFAQSLLILCNNIGILLKISQKTSR